MCFAGEYCQQNLQKLSVPERKEVAASPRRNSWLEEYLSIIG
jgi:hypothetical protein